MMIKRVLLQITPAHDPNDFEVGKRHKLEFINIFTDDGKINSNGGSDFVGMPRFEARVAVTEALKSRVILHYQSVKYDLIRILRVLISIYSLHIGTL